MKLINRILGVIFLVFAVIVSIYLFQQGPYSMNDGCNYNRNSTTIDTDGLCIPSPTITHLIIVIVFFVLPPLTAFILSWKYPAKKWSFIVILSIFSLYILLVLTVVGWIALENHQYKIMDEYNKAHYNSETHTFIE
jgi:hypothetical protein